jgi:hypothetical protein
LQWNSKLLVNRVKEACREAEKNQADRSNDEIIFNLESGRVVISDLFLNSFVLPLALVGVAPPNKLNWFTDRARLSASGMWTFTPSNDPSVNYHGSLYIPSSQFCADLNASLSRTSQNQPTISNVDCIVSLNKSEMLFSSPNPKARDAIVKIESNVTELLREQLEASLCGLISYVLQSTLNSVLSTFRTKISLWDIPKVTLDYSLLADPYVDPVDLSIKSLLQGSIIVNDESISIFPHDMVSVSNDTKMVTTLFSDYILNSLLASAYQADLLRSIYVDSAFSKEIAKLLKLVCRQDELCVGSVFRSKSSKSDYSELSLSIDRVPSVIFTEDGGFLQLNGSLSLDVHDDKGVNLYSSPFSLVASLIPSIQQQKLYNMLTMKAEMVDIYLSARCNGTSSHEEVIRLLSAILEEVITVPLRQGIPVPMFLNNELVPFRDHHLSFHNRTLILSQSF